MEGGTLRITDAGSVEKPDEGARAQIKAEESHLIGEQRVSILLSPL